MNDPKPLLSILVPCYRDETGLEELHRRLTLVCKGLGCTYEIVLVEDGSPDRTWDAICRLAASDPAIVGIRLSRNHGHQLAVTAGLHNVRGERVMIIDSDLQDPPELLPDMMKLMDAGADNVYGQRLSREGVPLWKKFCYKAYYKLLSALAGCHIPPDTGDFRLISRRVVNLVNSMPEHHRFLRGMISWLGFTQVPIFYHREARFAGESGYTLAKLFRVAVDGITSFSIKPLRLASLLGALFGFLCLLGVGYSIFGYLQGNTGVAGWTSIMAVILLSFSLQFFVLGMIGEYIGRLFIEQKGRPLFIVDKVVGGGRSGNK
ncbi:MAG: glycosyltransferase family 2 protein [Verrucomicrobiota bacterium]